MTRTEKERLELIRKELQLSSQLAKSTADFIADYSRIQDVLEEIEKNQEKLKSYSHEKGLYNLSEQVYTAKNQIERVMRNFTFIKS